MEYIRLNTGDAEGIQKMSDMAKAIVKKHFDPLIGSEQNDYMIAMFQTPEAIGGQLEKGYRYYFVLEEGAVIGFQAFYPKGETMYLSKFYLWDTERRKGYSKAMLDFVIEETKAAGLKAIELNVNRGNDARFAYEHLGFYIAREEKNDIGHGYYMDDYVYRYDL